MITVAISRGRLLKETVELLKRAGFSAAGISNGSRKLIFEYPKEGLKVLIVRPSDVPSYVEYGASDCGIVGRDTLLEEKHDLYEPLDLKIGRCKLVVAAPSGFSLTSERIIKVATKYPRIAHNYFTQRGINVEIVKLYGSVELAPIVGLSDVVVDLMSTGETLRKNNLVVLETIAEITAKLIVNRVSMKVKSHEIKEFIRKLKEVREF
ncbi:ATP phosphoribosyltransferase [bacterium HR37]|nr:ATP phosphoribosyltransferase [bacterium HR37]